MITASEYKRLKKCLSHGERTNLWLNFLWFNKRPPTCLKESIDFAIYMEHLKENDILNVLKREK